MPELPEVEYAAGIARRTVEGRAITRVLVLHPSQQRTLPPDEARSLIGEVVVKIERRGKTQLFRLTSGRTLAVHFRMTGDWTVNVTKEPLPRFARAALEFDHGQRLVLDDPRALSVIQVHGPDAELTKRLGPEATEPQFTARVLLEALSSRRVPIKVALLDQRVVAGLGNIYAAEALWRARLDPRLPANKMDVARAQRLVTAIRAVLARATRAVARYYGAGGSSANRFRVYDREGLPCSRCGTPIKRIIQAQRSTYFCPRCQRK